MSSSALPARARCVVIGMGAMGSAAAYRLARRIGDETVVLEQFAPGHTRGSSEDHSRIIRHSYASTVYTRLTPAMFAAWTELEAESGQELIARSGGLDFGDPTIPGSVREVEDCAAALTAQGIEHELLDAARARRRWPLWRLEEDTRVLFQADAGSLDIGRACAAHLALAAGAGARLCPGTRVERLEAAADGGGVRVHTDRGVCDAEDVVVCAGKWTDGLLGDIAQLALDYSREQVTYFAAPRLSDFAPERFPVWIRHGEPCFYGIGTHGIPAVKAAEDLGGPRVEVDDEESPTDPAREVRVREFLADQLPEAVGPVVHSRACLYELPPGRDFLLGPLAENPRVKIVIGAGHGAKFAALFGTVLSEMVLDGRTPHPVDAFAPTRSPSGPAKDETPTAATDLLTTETP